MYFLANQGPIHLDSLSLVIRTAGDPRPLVPPLRAIVQTVALRRRSNRS